MKKALLLLLTLFLVPFTAYGIVVSTDSLANIEQKINEVDNDALVVFDIDGVLSRPTDQILQARNKEYRKALEEETLSRFGREKANILFSEILRSRPEDHVVPTMPALIKSLKRRGMKALVLTNCTTGPYGKIPSMAKWSINRLHELNYDFSQFWPDTSDALFSELVSSRYPGSTPQFKLGVLFSAGGPKGAVLEEFLKKNNLQPSHIIFIDDKIENVIDVEKAASRLNIPFDGFHFTRAFMLDLTPLDRSRAQLQFQTLEQTGSWASDKDSH